MFISLYDRCFVCLFVGDVCMYGCDVMVAADRSIQVKGVLFVRLLGFLVVVCWGFF